MGPLTVTRYAGQNLVRGFGPDERPWLSLCTSRYSRIATSGSFDAAKDTATYALVGHFCKPTFHQVDPRAVSGSEVQVKARPLGEPVSDQRCFVSAVVVQHDVNVKIGRHIGFDGVEKPAEFLRTMAAMQWANHPAGLQIES